MGFGMGLEAGLKAGLDVGLGPGLAAGLAAGLAPGLAGARPIAGPERRGLRLGRDPPARGSPKRFMRGPNGPFRRSCSFEGGAAAFFFFTASLTTSARPMSRFPCIALTAACPSSGSRIITIANPFVLLVFGSVGITKSSIGARTLNNSRSCSTFTL